MNSYLRLSVASLISRFAYQSLRLSVASLISRFAYQSLRLSVASLISRPFGAFCSTFSKSGFGSTFPKGGFKKLSWFYPFV
jgi:hypothetical protein